MQRGYKRSIPGLYRFLKKQGILAQKLPNPKYIPKPYEQMKYPGQRIQVDVKSVPACCLVNNAKGKKFYQYTAIDEYSRWRYVEAFEEHSTYSSAQFLKHLIQRFPYANRMRSDRQRRGVYKALFHFRQRNIDFIPTDFKRTWHPT